MAPEINGRALTDDELCEGVIAGLGDVPVFYERCAACGVTRYNWMCRQVTPRGDSWPICGMCVRQFRTSLMLQVDQALRALRFAIYRGWLDGEYETFAIWISRTSRPTIERLMNDDEEFRRRWWRR